MKSSSAFRRVKSDLSLLQQQFQVDRIVDSVSDAFIWVTYTEQHFCVIRTRLDRSFFRWQRRGSTNFDVTGKVMVGLVTHDFELKVTIQPHLRHLSPLHTKQLLIYVFSISVIFFGLVMILAVLWGCYKEWTGRQPKMEAGTESDQQNSDVEK